MEVSELILEIEDILYSVTIGDKGKISAIRDYIDSVKKELSETNDF